MEYDFPQHGGHDARGARADHVFHVGEVFFQHAAFVVGDLGDEARRDTNAIVGKNAESGGLFEQRDLGGT